MGLSNIIRALRTDFAPQPVKLHPAQRIEILHYLKPALALHDLDFYDIASAHGSTSCYGKLDLTLQDGRKETIETGYAFSTDELCHVLNTLRAETPATEAAHAHPHT